MFGFHIPDSPYSFDIISGFSTGYKTVLEKKDVIVEGGLPGEKTHNKDLRFAGRIYIYHETPLLEVQKEQLKKQYKKHKLSLILRGVEYAFDRNYKNYIFPNVNE